MGINRQGFGGMAHLLKMQLAGIDEGLLKAVLGLNNTQIRALLLKEGKDFPLTRSLINILFNCLVTFALSPTKEAKELIASHKARCFWLIERSSAGRHNLLAAKRTWLSNKPELVRALVTSLWPLLR